MKKGTKKNLESFRRPSTRVRIWNTPRMFPALLCMKHHSGGPKMAAAMELKCGIPFLLSSLAAVGTTIPQ